MPERKSLSNRHKPDITVVFGKTGMGKTRWSIRNLRSHTRVLMLDPNLDDPYPGLHMDEINDMIEHMEQYPAFRLRTHRLDFLRPMCALARAATRTTLVFEEAQRYLTPRTNLEREAPEVLDVVYRGRHANLALVIVALRASTVHIAVRSQWTRLVTFRQTEPADLAWIEEQAGESLDLPNLQEGEYYDITPVSVTRERLSSHTAGRRSA